MLSEDGDHGTWVVRVGLTEKVKSEQKTEAREGSDEVEVMDKEDIRTNIISKSIQIL